MEASNSRLRGALGDAEAGLLTAPVGNGVTASAPATAGQVAPSSSVTRSARPDVVVIGAGLAGLATARLLKRQGASVVLLEARDRVGGRVHSQQLGSGPVIDLGAQFIGDAQQRISALVDEVGLTRVRPYQDGDSLYLDAERAAPMRLTGDDVPMSLLGKLDAFNATRRLDKALGSRKARVAHLDSITASDLVREFTFTHAAEMFLLGYIESETCVPGNEISAYEMMDQIASVGGRDGERHSAQWFLAEGTGPLAQHLADGLGTSLVTQAPVTQLVDQGSRIAVETPHGSYAAHQLVVAVPPQLYTGVGLLPLLSPAHRQVLATYRAGAAIKTMLVFATPWWRELGLCGRAGGVGRLFNAMVDVSPADASVGILVLFATAGSGRRLGELRSEADRISQALNWLGALVGQAVPEPLASRSVDWSADPLALGGYASRRGLGGWAAVPDLFRSVGRLHFAGTETATEWRSFMEGALQSADRAAEEVLKASR